jgi:acyl-CoA reductase-like NAD-dependent aldehyde dehydrogenase
VDGADGAGLRQYLHPQALGARSVAFAVHRRTAARAGLPEGVFNVVQGDKEAVDALLEHPDVQAVSFVGSTPIAKYI